MAKSVSSAGSKGSFNPDSDVHITYEDQQKINKFARHNAKLDDFKEELKIKQNELKNIEDACEELILADSDKNIPFFMGEVFIYHGIEQTQKMLDEAKSRVQSEIEDLELKCAELRSIMSDMKTQLYAKFGNHINLEAEDD
ncbi:probable prefoldin subunit 4 [Zootermopsis nevadensis]|uniref:Prefoldin subunit 4 n=1 Tax=Zootermopsis nevadensis TaxID=136037 RepID=A0A067R1Q5_ZOONE|nr:probable prefoldin subunit 4 [Zootermopsis nevadensis]KDR16741.1 Prefoldin subunit 4 [Zootermopsis nevadensis]